MRNHSQWTSSTDVAAAFIATKNHFDDPDIHFEFRHCFNLYKRLQPFYTYLLLLTFSSVINRVRHIYLQYIQQYIKPSVELS